MISAAEFAELAAFVAVAQERSFRRGAERLGVTPSRVSQAVRAIEARLGVRLLNRTTRSVSTTATGQSLLEQLAPSMSTIESALAAATRSDGRPRGALRLTMPRLATTMVLAPVMSSYSNAYPDVVLEISVSEQLEDIVGEGFDAAIRLGEDVDADMIAVPVTSPFTTAVVGSPTYFARHPPPRHPNDLTAHRCIQCQSGPDRSLYRWEFEQHGEEIKVDVTGPVASDSVDLMLRAALDGIGLFHGVDLIVADHLANGELVRVLADWSPTYPGFHLFYSGSRHTPPALLALIDMLRVRPAV